VGTNEPTSDPGLSTLNWPRREARAYTGSKDRPLGSYAALMLAYAVFVALLSALTRLSGKSVPERPGLADFGLVGGCHS
jgi:hypothetical protein